MEYPECMKEFMKVVKLERICILYNLSSYFVNSDNPLWLALGILKAIAELRPLRRVIFNALYNR